MTSNPNTVDDAIEEAISEEVAQKSPSVGVRPSLPFLIVGNVALFLLVLAALLDWPKWWMIGGAFILALLIIVAVDPIGRAKDRYKAARLATVSGDASERAALSARIEKEAESLTATTIDAVAIPGLLLTLVAAIALFFDLNSILSEWHWSLRWLGSLLGAAAGWFALVVVWGVANMSPGSPSAELIEPDGSAEELGREDANDIQIIRQKVRLESLSKRVETYTLEGALLSALSFSSFISMIVSERDYLDRLAKLLDATLEWKKTSLANIISPSGGQASYPDLWQFASSHLVPLIGLSLLLCASTFLGVLVARLRFNEAYRDAEVCLHIAERFNEKEEQALLATQSARAEFYGTAIPRLLRSASEWETNLSWVVLQMRISRDAGILFFVLTLILCGLFFAPAVAVVIAIFFVLVALAGYYHRLARSLHRRRIFGYAVLGPLSNFFRSRS